MDLHCQIITPSEVIYDALVGLVQVPGAKGNFTLLKNHAPIISVLTKGQIRVIGKDGHESFFDCTNGVLECEDNTVVILIHKS